MIFCRARATAIAPGGTSSVMTDPAAVYAPSPIVTGATNIVSLPMRTESPITVRCLFSPSKLTKTVAAPMFVSAPISASPT